MDLTFDAHLLDRQGVLGRFGLGLHPISRPTDEIGGKDHESFLKDNSRFGAHLDAVEIENLFGFLDPGFDGLAAIVMGESFRQVLCDRVAAKV